MSNWRWYPWWHNPSTVSHIASMRGSHRRWAPARFAPLLGIAILSGACSVGGSGTMTPSATANSTLTAMATGVPNATVVAGTLHVVVNFAVVCRTYHCASSNDAWCVGGSSQDNFPSYTLSNIGQIQLSWVGAVVSAQSMGVALTLWRGTLGNHVSQIVRLSGPTRHDFDLTFSWSGHSASESVHCLLL